MQDDRPKPLRCGEFEIHDRHGNVIRSSFDVANLIVINDDVLQCLQSAEKRKTKPRRA